MALHALHLSDVLFRTEPFDGRATALDDTLSVFLIANVVDDQGFIAKWNRRILVRLWVGVVTSEFSASYLVTIHSTY